jgi:hypothetical protein
VISSSRGWKDRVTKEKEEEEGTIWEGEEGSFWSSLSRKYSNF